jgi:signal transduction histidine kinase
MIPHEETVSPQPDAVRRATTMPGDDGASLTVPVSDESERGDSLATADLVLEIATAAGGERELDHILNATLARLRAVLPVTGGSIALVEGDELVIRAAVGPFADRALGQRLPRGQGRSWQVIVTRQPFLSNDLQVDGLRVRTPGAEGAIRSWLAVPIVRREEGIGLLEIDATHPNAFAESDVELLETIARALAGPVDLAGRYAAERRATLMRDAFVGVISHELRTPITTIYGASKLLRGRTLSPEVQDQALEDIEAEADRLRRLIEDLLVLSRAEGGHLELARDPILVAHVLRQVVAAEAPRWPDHRLTVDAPRVLPLVVGEETAVEQILRNLVTNGAKYSPPGSEICIVARAVKNEVVVRVLDEGIGIDREDVDQLFDLFYRAPQATRQASGAGIGLFVCRQLVEAMGGRIWARSRPEGGSEFGIALPTAQPEVDSF